MAVHDYSQGSLLGFQTTVFQLIVILHASKLQTFENLRSNIKTLILVIPPPQKKMDGILPAHHSLVNQQRDGQAGVPPILTGGGE